jgi:hypothetical protein
VVVFLVQFQNLNILCSLATIFLLVSSIVVILFWLGGNDNDDDKEMKRSNAALVPRKNAILKLKNDPTPRLDWLPHVAFLLRALLVLTLVLALSIAAKSLLNGRLLLQDDAHVEELLRAKFSSYESVVCCVFVLVWFCIVFANSNF